MKRVALLAIALAATPVDTARAGSSCGGGSSGGSSSSSSSSSSGGSSSSSSSSSSESSSKPACVETTDVHGYRECTKFGAWGSNLRVPTLIVELGFAVRQFASPLGERTGTITHADESFTYRVIGPRSEAKPAMDTAVVAQLRIGTALAHGFYVALDGEAGGVTEAAGSAEMTSTGAHGSLDFQQTAVTVMSGLGVAGLRLRLGNLHVAGEAAGGFRTLSYSYQSKYLACEQTTTLTDTSPVLEARARAAWWVTPFITVGATAGKSLIDDAWMGGLFVGGHTRTFGGQ